MVKQAPAAYFALDQIDITRIPAGGEDTTRTTLALISTTVTTTTTTKYEPVLTYKCDFDANDNCNGELFANNTGTSNAFLAGNQANFLSSIFATDVSSISMSIIFIQVKISIV